MRYRINWQSNKTNTTGHGDPTFSNHEAAQKVADQQNRQRKDLHHWVEAVPDKQTTSSLQAQRTAMISTNPNHNQIPDWAQFQVSLFDHPVITDQDGVLRYKAKPLMRWLCNQIDLTTMWKAYKQNLFSRTEFMQFYREIGYSLTGFEEIWEKALDEMEDQDTPSESTLE